MPVFDGVRYSLSPSLPQTRRTELAAILDLNGAAPHPPYTHLIVLPASHAHSDATNDPTLKLVTDRWVDRSVVLGKCQPEQYYSPDPTMIFSGVVACATDLSTADLEVLSAGITALGGQWRIGLTRDVTHLFALRPGSDKYNTALHFAPQTHMHIITPHWFDDSVRLGRRVPETPYTWPDPLVLRPGANLNLGDTAATEAKRKRTGTEAGDTTSVPNEGENAPVWAGRRILLSPSLELGVSSRPAIEAGIRRAGGVVVKIPEDADEHAEEKAVDECDILVTRWRSGRAYFKAARASLLIGTLSWLFSVESNGTLHSPLDSLLWYPTPRGGIPDLIDCEISVTNYTGAARDYLKRLIGLIGAKFTPSMSQTNKVLVAGFQPSPKTTRALSWSIPVVNHTWLEDCFVEWRALTVGLERYIVYPPGVDFGNMLLTRQDEAAPSSQSVSTLRLSGAALPGGRGVGKIDLEQEELRDAEYLARSHGLGGSLTRPKNQEQDTANPSRLDGHAPTDTPARPRFQADSVKKTPSTRAKRRSMSSGSATGAFVDHVIELPADQENDKRHLQTPLLGSRRTPKDTSRASSAGLFSASSDVELVTHSRGRTKERGKAKETSAQKSKPQRRGKGMSDLSGEESEVSVPPRRAAGATSRTPVKSGMKPRPRSKSLTGPTPVAGAASEAEVIITAASGAAAGKGKERDQVSQPIRNGAGGTKGKDKEKTSEGGERLRSTTRSPPPEPKKKTQTPKRRSSVTVLVPSMPKEYFSSQSVRAASEAESIIDRERKNDERPADAHTASAKKTKALAPAASMHAISAEAPISTSKRSKVHPGNPSVRVSNARKAELRSKPKPKPGVSRKSADDDDEDGGERPAKSSTSVSARFAEPKPKPQTKSKPKSSVSKKQTTDDDKDSDDDAPMVIDAPVVTPSTGRTGPRRSAADKAATKLRNDIMPDVISYEKERKQQGKRRRSEDWESAASMRGREEGREREREEKSGKKRKVLKEEEEEVEEAEVEVLVPSVRAKSRATIGKGKRKSAGLDENMDRDDPVMKHKSGGAEEKKGGRGRVKESAVRVMTTGVSLSDETVKRLVVFGVQMTTKPTDCTHLIAKGIVRTEKFLCAMSVSPYILTEEWATASAKSGKLLPEKDYFLSDAAAEQKWDFKLADALERSREPDRGPNLFKQMTFYVTPKAGVDVKLLKNIVAAGGGQVQTATTPTARILRGKGHRYVVSSEADKAIWRPLAAEGFTVYSPELVLRGALRQEIEWERGVCVLAG